MSARGTAVHDARSSRSKGDDTHRAVLPEHVRIYVECSGDFGFLTIAVCGCENVIVRETLADKETQDMTRQDSLCTYKRNNESRS